MTAIKPLPPKRIAPTLPPKRETAVAEKTFRVADWDTPGVGKKIIIYAYTGKGKTTCSALAPRPVFIGLDDGGQELKDPRTGGPLKVIPDVMTFQDVRDVLHQSDLFTDYETIVIDTGTVLERLAHDHVLETVLAGQGKTTFKASNIEVYGWNKGYRHIYDQMNLILQDCDILRRQGKNTVINCQLAPIRVPNPGGEDYLKDAPELQDRKGASVLSSYLAWADYILRIDYQTVQAEAGKAASTGERAIFVQPEVYFEAKARGFPQDLKVVSFETPTDDSIWKFIFDKAWEIN